VSLEVELTNLLGALRATRERHQVPEYADLAAGCFAVLERHGYELGWAVLNGPTQDEWCQRLCAEFEAGMVELADGEHDIILLGAINVLKYHMRRGETCPPPTN
jgi:hypothetical protein